MDDRSRRDIRASPGTDALIMRRDRGHVRGDGVAVQPGEAAGVDEYDALPRTDLAGPDGGAQAGEGLRRVPGAPIVTVQSAATLIDRSVQAVNQAVPRLAEAGILTQTTVGRRNRAFEARELIDAFTALERRLGERH